MGAGGLVDAKPRAMTKALRDLIAESVPSLLMVTGDLVT
jgi:hypothetical protein